jgi:predicted transcriptional regulator
MATITIRKLSDETQRALKRRAAANNRSMEAEARAVLEEHVAPQPFIESWLADAETFRNVPDDGSAEDFTVPPRATPRPVDLD